MNEGLPPDIKKEELPGEKEAQEVAQGLEKATAQLEKMDPSKITPEDFKLLEVKVAIIIEVLSAYAGAKITGFGFEHFKGLEVLLAAPAVAVGITVITASCQGFIASLKKFIGEDKLTPTT